MSGPQRRRSRLDQHFLVDDRLIARFVAGLDLRPGELVVDLGAGSGALALPLARAGARVWAVEADPRWAARLARAADQAGLGGPDGGTSGTLRVIQADLRRFRLPPGPYRVVANPPFGLTSEVLSLLLDDPGRGPERADLVLQHQVARRHAATPPAALRTAAWSPWWRFELGLRIGRAAFQPAPTVDARVLTITRRADPVLPPWLAPGFIDVLRPAWAAAPAGNASAPTRSRSGDGQ